MDRDRRWAPRTLAAQAGGFNEPHTGGVVPAVHPATTYLRDPLAEEPPTRIYTRDHNPNYAPCEELLARLEGGEDALLFASGMAAATTVIDILEPGAHVVAPRQMYWSLRLWLTDLAARGRIALDLVPAGDLEALGSAIRPGETRLVWVESPANPTCEITDLAAAAELAHRAGARIVADGTLATPVHVRHMDLGVDLVVHSATKQLNGHSDVLAGALITARADDVWERIRYERAYRGAVLGPFEAWLLLRGMRTLALRVTESARNAQRVAELLDEHAAVSRVFYPGLPDHPGHDVARRQMQDGFGCVVSFRLAGGEAAARAVASRLELFRHATSLGGVESLVEHRASVEQGSEVPDDLLRLSVGIEDPDDLLTDLSRAIDRAC